MGYEITRIWQVFNRYRIQFAVIWILSIAFAIVFYFISPPGYKSSSQIGMENTRKPWADFKQGQLPRRQKMVDDEKSQTMSLRDPFWNFMYDQIEKSTYDFTPFFKARTTVFRIIDELGIRHHFDNGVMTSEEIVLAFTQNLEVEFDRVGGLYNISYTFVEPEIARAIVNKYNELFVEFIDQISRQNNLQPVEAVAKNIARIESKIAEIDTLESKLKSESGVIAPTEYFSVLTNHLYSVEMRIVQAESLSRAARELLVESNTRISSMSKYGTGEGGELINPISDVLFDPLLYVILARIFWDNLNYAQAEMIYKENTVQLEYWKERAETSKRLLSRRTAEDETARASELLSTLAAESGKAVALRQYKSEIQNQMNQLPKLEKEFVYLHRQKIALGYTLKNLQDLQSVGLNYLEKGDKIAAVLDPPYLPRRKSDPHFLKILLSVIFASTVCGFGWFFIRENIEFHSGKNS